MQRLGLATGDAWRGVRGFGLLANFAVAKVVVFAVPLALAAVSAPRVYGAIEVGYAAGLMIASMALLAPLYGITHQYLVGEQRAIRDQAALLVLAVCLLSLAATSVAAFAGASITVLLSLGLAGATAIQLTAGYLLRLREGSYLVAWSDGFTLIAIALVVALSARFLATDLLSLLVAFLLLISLAAVAVASVVLARSIEPGLKQRLAASARLGAPMYAYAIFNIWAGASGRVVIGLLSLADVAAYAVAFRIAGVALLTHRLTITVLWSRVYTASPEEADRLLAFQVAVAGLIAAAVSVGGHWLIDALDLLASDARAAGISAAILPVVALQIFFFAAHALLQARVNRTGAAGRSLLPMAAITAAGLVLILAAKTLGAGIGALCWLLALYCATYFFATLMFLSRQAMPHPRVAAVGAGGGAVLALIAML